MARYDAHFLPGVIIACNPDGTYDVKVRRNSTVYPSIGSGDRRTYFEGDSVNIQLVGGDKNIPEIFGSAANK